MITELSAQEVDDTILREFLADDYDFLSSHKGTPIPSFAPGRKMFSWYDVLETALAQLFLVNGLSERANAKRVAAELTDAVALEMELKQHHLTFKEFATVVYRELRCYFTGNLLRNLIMQVRVRYVDFMDFWQLAAPDA